MENQMINLKHVILPPVKVMGIKYVFPWHAYIMLVCEIPAGKVAPLEEIMRLLTEAYGMELPLEQSLMDEEMRLHETYPYWRVVSERGHIHCTNKNSGALNKLRAEGIEILEPNPERDSLIIKDFKEKKFDFSSLKISILGADQQLWEKLMQYKNSPTAP